MPRLFKKKPEPELPEGEFDIRTWTPANRAQARSAVGKGFMWYWDNSKRTLLYVLVGSLTLLGVIYKGVGFDNYQPVVMRTFEASIGIPSTNPQSDAIDIDDVEFVTVQKRGGGIPLVVNGKRIEKAFTDPDVLVWKEYGTGSLFVWRVGSPNLGYLENIIKETK